MTPVVAEVVRCGFTESRHRGSVAVLDSTGEPLRSVGEVGAPVFPRSSNKPLQATGMVECGLGLRGRLLALAAASHSGEPFHVDGVRQILTGAGLTEAALGCPPALPLDETAYRQVVRAGSEPDAVHMNCSGKHAGMLATCVTAGWPVETYLDPDHPLQQRLRATVSQLTCEEVATVGVDGCGAPLFAMSLTGLARGFRALVLAQPGTARREVADSMRAYPRWMSGTGRTDAALMAAVPGLLIKGGAEGVLAFALPDGRAAACKVEDGNPRAVPAIAVALLRLLGVPGSQALEEVADTPVLGGGKVVGQVQAVLPW